GSAENHPGDSGVTEGSDEPLEAVKHAAKVAAAGAAVGAAAAAARALASHSDDEEQESDPADRAKGAPAAEPESTAAETRPMGARPTRSSSTTSGTSGAMPGRAVTSVRRLIEVTSSEQPRARGLSVRAAGPARRCARARAGQGDRDRGRHSDQPARHRAPDG